MKLIKIECEEVEDILEKEDVPLKDYLSAVYRRCMETWILLEATHPGKKVTFKGLEKTESGKYEAIWRIDENSV